MHFEVEQKFPVENLADVERRLRELGAEFAPTIEQSDTYYAHPARDFAQTDEALRIRRTGESVCVTYKGPRVDSTTKTRREIEIPLAGGPAAAAQCAEMLQCLGFRRVAEVCKRRLAARLVWEQHEVEAVLDNVRALGTFVELETSANEQSVQRASKAIASLAAALELSSSQRRSYLELLLERSTS